METFRKRLSMYAGEFDMRTEKEIQEMLALIERDDELPQERDNL